MRSLFLLVALFFFTACSLTENRVNHVVLVWFNDDVSSENIEQIKQASKQLKAIGELKFIQVGSAIQSERPIVDDSFDLGLIMQFDSKEAMERYVDDPRHKAFVEQHIKGKVKKLLVYDF